MPRTKRPTDRVVYQIKVTLRGSKPPIWRRFQVASDTSLVQLHRILQCVMGWEDYHMHQFIVGGVMYGNADMMEDFDTVEEKTVTLDQIVRREKFKFIYEYDFGDGWEHELLVEKILPVEEGKTYPVCLTGKRACPPEDCGGIWGYSGFLEAVQDPAHPEHEEMLDWVGGEFDPAAFDLQEVNAELKAIKLA
jgi:hypothetical protein